MLPGTIIGHRFKIERTAGSGGMGVVFRARDQQEGATVAVKLLRGEDRTEVERFNREAAILADLRHPAIVRYIAHGAAADGKQYLAMEWLEGEDLERRLVRGRLSPADSFTLIRRIAGALAVAHAHGVLHRDIKPSNIFLIEGDIARAKLLDFGIARLADDTHRLTQSGTLIGTPGYMAPEQVQGVGAPGPYSDVFALGCVLFECIAGRPAFDGGHAMAILAKIVLQDVPPLRQLQLDVPEPVERLASWMLAKAPDKRPRSGAEVVAAIELICQDGGTWGADAVRGMSAGDMQSTADTPTQDGVSLTLNEQRIVSVVLVGAHGTPELATLHAPDVERLGGWFNTLADGSMMVTIWGPGSAVDRAERAARCALAIQAHFVDVPVYIVTGRGVVSAKVVEGEVIDRGVRAVQGMTSRTIQMDSATAGMLGPRFITEHEGDAVVLRGERHLRESGALLLGKAVACVGRGRELSLFEGIFASVVEEPQVGAVLVTGPAGSGKSRLRREFIAKLVQQKRPVEILTGRADSLGERSPFGPVADAIRKTAGIGGGESIELRRQRLTLRLGRHLKREQLVRVAAFLGELVHVSFPDDEHRALRAARENAQLMGDAMRAAWEDWLTAECEVQPVVLVLEDLHWTDAATVQIIDATLRNLRNLPLMVLALARAEVYTHFPKLWAERQVQILRLSPLSSKASEQLVRSALGDGTSADVVARIVEHADGNPFYIEELVRAVAAGRGDAFPDSMLATIEARLDAEDATSKRILRAASVFGMRFTMKGVAALLGGDDYQEEAGGWLELLAARELVAPASDRDAANDTGYVFRHSLVREAVYATLTEDDRALGHRLAGAWLEQIGHTDATAMAEHFHRGGESARALRWYLRAAEQALNASDLAATIERVERGVACGASGEDKGMLCMIAAEAHLWRGEIDLAAERGAEAAGLLTRGTAAWFRAVSQVVLALGKSGDRKGVERWVAPVMSAVPAPDAASARYICLSSCAIYLIFAGDYEGGDALISVLERAVMPDAEAIAQIQQTRSIRALAAGDPSAALAPMQAAFTAFEESGDQRNMCVTRANIGFILAELGDYDSAERSLRSALSTATRLGVEYISMFTRHNLGHVLACRGDLEEARRMEQQAVEAFRSEGDSRALGLARSYLAKIEALAGNLDVAEREARAAAKVLLGAPPIRASVLAVLARTLLASRRNDEALDVAREAFTLLEELGTIEEGEALVRLVYAEALDANGWSAEFYLAITSARDLLLSRAAKISDPAWRERFLRGVADNAQTLALASRADERNRGAS